MVHPNIVFVKCEWPASIRDSVATASADLLKELEQEFKCPVAWLLPLVPDPSGSADRPVAPQKRKVSSPTHSSNGHSPPDTSPSPLKKKKKPGAVNSGSKDQVGPLTQCILLEMCCVAHNMWTVQLAVNKGLSINARKQIQQWTPKLYKAKVKLMWSEWFSSFKRKPSRDHIYRRWASLY